ncbi:ferredoxin [Streptomyces sp. NPDC088358]|uniref:ferredoxin n=1 Tax=Streptomyces sp. NPDC088358 TaxID=3365857 RepID=UPI0037F47290
MTTTKTKAKQTTAPAPEREPVRSPEPGSLPEPSRFREPTRSQEPIRFLEDRFDCAQACVECARACALRASCMDPGGPEVRQLARRMGLMCAEVCDATCLVLDGQHPRGEAGIRVQVEWCRSVCRECADVFDRCPGAQAGARACRACAQACTDFLATLLPV